MRIAILGPGKEKTSYTTNRLVEEAKKAGKAELIPLIDIRLRIERKLHILHGKKSLEKYDYILPRIDSKRATIGYPVIRFLDRMGVKKPYPAETILIAHNKFLTLEQLVAGGVRVPETYLTGSKAVAREIVKKQKMPIILKILSSFGGHGVMFLESKEAAETMIEAMSTLKQEILIEKYIPNPGEDIRGIVAGDEVIASYKRVAAPGEKKANIHMGGRGVPYKLDSEMQEIALKSARAIKARVCAIDMIQSRDGPQVIEVNINPGLQGIEKCTSINVAKRIIDFCAGEARR